MAGAILDGSTRGPLQGPPEYWIETLTSFALDLGFDTFLLMPTADPVAQIERFATEVAPAVRAAVARSRTQPDHAQEV